MNRGRLAIIIVFSLGFLCFIAAVALSFVAKGGGIFALGALGAALIACSPLASVIVED